MLIFNLKTNQLLLKMAMSAEDQITNLMDLFIMKIEFQQFGIIFINLPFDIGEYHDGVVKIAICYHLLHIYFGQSYFPKL